MTGDFAEAIRIEIATLPFIDRLAGMVRPVTIKTEQQTGSFTKQIFPVACNVSAADCINQGKYQDLVPNDSKKSVIYFEENGGSVVIGKERNNFQFRAGIRIVGWLNLGKLGVTGCSWSSVAVLQILSKLPQGYFNLNNTYTKCRIASVFEAEKSPAIFSKYSYDESVIQYLLYPFDYFALNLTIEYVVPLACINALTLADPINCPAV